MSDDLIKNLLAILFFVMGGTCLALVFWNVALNDPIKALAYCALIWIIARLAQILLD